MQLLLPLLQLLVLLLLTASATTTRSAAQTRSPTRKPSTATPLCALYGQLPQILNGTGRPQAFNGAEVAVSADGSVVAVGAPEDSQDGGDTIIGKITTYARPAGSPTSTLFTFVNTIALPPSLGLTLAPGRGMMSMSAAGDVIAVRGQAADNGLNGSLVVIQATQRAFKTFNTTWFLAQDVGVTPSAFFGSAVSVSRDGNLVAVGARVDELSGPEVGAVAVFRRSPTTKQYAVDAVLRPSPAADHLMFGASVAIADAGVLITSAINFDRVGAVYTFARSVDGIWAQQGPAIPADTPNFDPIEFGFTLAIDRAGLLAIIGDPYDRTNLGGAGAAYFFSRPSRSTLWGSPQRFAPTATTSEESGFGWSVALSDDTLTAIIGAPQYSSIVGAASSWFRLNRNATTSVWRVTTGYASAGPVSPTQAEGITTTLLGHSVSVSSDGTVVVVGAPARADASGQDVGGAEVWACGL